MDLLNTIKEGKIQKITRCSKRRLRLDGWLRVRGLVVLTRKEDFMLLPLAAYERVVEEGVARLACAVGVCLSLEGELQRKRRSHLRRTAPPRERVYL